MGITVAQGGMAFGIAVDDPSSLACSPGDTIVGCAIRKMPLVSPDAVVTVTLCGRAKTKLIVRSGNNSTRTYRGRFGLVDQRAHMQTLFRGPLHIVNGEPARQWPFTIRVPTHCAPKALGPVSQAESYLPTDAASVAATPLPNSFYMDGGPGFSHRQREGFVEYFITATLTYTHGGERKSAEATLPIALKTVTGDPPIVDFQLRRYRQIGCVSSFKLLPGVDDSQLTFKHKFRQALHSSKVPRFQGFMEMALPGTIQLDNPSTIPILLRFVPDPKMTSSELAGTPIEITLVSMHMQVETEIGLRCEGTFGPHDGEAGFKTRVPIWPPIRGGGGAILIPCTPEQAPVDVGARADFKVSRVKAFRDNMSPTSTTFNIKRWHRADFEFRARVGEAGEFRMKKSLVLTILPPGGELRSTAAQAAEQVGGSAQAASAAVSDGEEAPPPPFQARSESWIQPPAEQEAPPSFAQVRKEDAMAGRDRNNGESAGGSGASAS
ncbi:uncharacterized protein E0L32_001648 [Thyridium curvatum]|uniref:Arrestin-like N-terminal domain-containing protein n=1 Tax=Thyridium curvatum TaxID=1093900 RepID=A0A507AWI1_9PEZI|nr:uncharacterized protein E0L32_001550 [Thyridium curvatum]XP_030990899.1 uncharacterized protein E0L32_001648 [Thyridium curvatum]TPX09090.1 hypothetical protein E0L32_001550 [Thyridium curvatum]TPX09188.1 hypothetical protein E0L32_001648 [Thyridium curvatum]